MQTLYAPLELRRGLLKLWEMIEAKRLPPCTLVSGAAGTGKTHSILFMLHTISLQVPHLRILVARKTRKSMTESVLAAYEDDILPSTGHSSIASFGPDRKNRQNYNYPNGSRWVLAGLEDPERVKSSSYDLAFLNEGSELAEQDVDLVQTRVGRPDRNAGYDAVIIDTNPSVASHFLKRRAEEGRIRYIETYHADNPAMHDGRDWTPKGVRYITRNLQPLRGSLRKRMLKGLWVAGDGAYFDGFDESIHVSTAAEHDPKLETILAADSGRHTGAVWFQLAGGAEPVVRVFGDFYSDKLVAYQAAKGILEASHRFCGHDVTEVLTDPAGSKGEAVVDTTVLEEWDRAGLPTTPWPRKRVNTGLAMLEALISRDPPRLVVHPRCKNLIQALGNYSRKKTRDGQWLDEPADPQHPFEDMIDPLRCGVLAELEGGQVSWGGNPLNGWRG